jgi:hypothetical protein
MKLTTRFERILALLVGLTALVASLLATLELDSGRKGDRASLLGARLPVQIFEGIASSQLRSDFHLNTQREAVGVGIAALSRQITALRAGQQLAFEGVVGRADYAASRRLQAAAREMAAISPESRGVDRHTAETILVTTKALKEQVRMQGKVIDRANRFSNRDGKAVFALSLVAISAALLGLAAVLKAGPGGRIALTAGALALALSIAWGGFALSV